MADSMWKCFTSSKSTLMKMLWRTNLNPLENEGCGFVTTLNVGINLFLDQDIKFSFLYPQPWFGNTRLAVDALARQKIFSSLVSENCCD